MVNVPRVIGELMTVIIDTIEGEVLSTLSKKKRKRSLKTIDNRATYVMKNSEGALRAKASLVGATLYKRLSAIL